jgi:hypothetical protein
MDTNVKEDTLTATLVSRIFKRSFATLALLGIVVVLALTALLNWSMSAAGNDTAPAFSKPIAGKSVSGSPSRRL